MKRIYVFLIAFIVVFAAFPSCEKPELSEKPNQEQPNNPDTPETPEDPGTPDIPVTPEDDVVPDPTSGISVTPTKPDADGACTEER